MAKEEQMIKISLTEYKELIMKEKTSDSLINEIANELLISLKKNLTHMKEDRWSSRYMFDELGLDKDCDLSDEYSKLIKVVLTKMKILDFEQYMMLWNEAQTNERKRTEIELRMEQMQKAKELRKENV